MPDRAYTYGVAARLSVATGVVATARTSAASAAAAIATGLAALSENVELSFPKDANGIAVSPAGAAFGVEGQLLIGSDESESAQSVAKDAAAAIATAITGTNPAVTVALDQENGQYVLEQIG